MRNRNLFVTGLLSLGLLAACSNDELDNVNNQGTGEGEKTLTQIAISVASADVATRAQSGNTGDPVFGENEEYTVNDLLVVFANTEGIAQEVIVPPMKDVTDADEADRMVRVTEPFSVTPGDYYVYVLANYANSKDALSPIVQNTTDMRTAFKIDATKLSELSESGNFLMSNWTVPVKTTIGSESATGKEVDDAGKEKTGGETLQLLKVDIERVVAKVTFDQYQSSAALQYLKRREIPAERLSVDASLDPYYLFISYMSSGKIKCGRNILLKNNIKSLQEVETMRGHKKIDHSKGKVVYEDGANWNTSLMGKWAKDVSDAVCGAVWNCVQNFVGVPHYVWEEDLMNVTESESRKTIVRRALRSIHDRIGVDLKEEIENL